MSHTVTSEYAELNWTLAWTDMARRFAHTMRQTIKGSMNDGVIRAEAINEESEQGKQEKRKGPTHAPRRSALSVIHKLCFEGQRISFELHGAVCTTDVLVT